MNLHSLVNALQEFAIMNILVGMEEPVSDEKVENDDGDIRLEISADQLFLHSLDRPQIKSLRFSVRVHGREIQRKRQIETEFPG